MIDKLAPRIIEFLKIVYPDTLEILGSHSGMTVVRNINTNNSSSEKQLGRLDELYNENLSSLSWILSKNHVTNNNINNKQIGRAHV